MSDAAFAGKLAGDYARLFGEAGRGWVCAGDGVTELVTGSGRFDAIWVHGGTGAAVAAALDRVAGAGRAFTVQVADPADPATLELIAARGLVVAEAVLVFGLDGPASYVPRDGVGVTRMTPSDAEVHQRIFREGFAMGEEIAALAGRPALFADPAVRGYLAHGEDDGVAASTGVSILDGELAAIYSVATLRTHRHRGLAAAVTAAAVDDVRRAGARRVILNPTAEGEPLYRGLGFVELARWATLSTT